MSSASTRRRYYSSNKEKCRAASERWRIANRSRCWGPHVSILDGAEIKEHVPCDRCHHGCSGPCPDCGAFEHHDEPHAPDCTIEETMRQLTVGIEGARWNHPTWRESA